MASLFGSISQGARYVLGPRSYVFRGIVTFHMVKRLGTRMDARFLAILFIVTCYNEGMTVGKSAEAAKRGATSQQEYFVLRTFQRHTLFYSKHYNLYI